MAAIVLAADSEKINPLWNPQWIAREAKLNPPTTSYRGHFVCVDGFGPVSAEERAAGLGMHGEAYTLPWQVESYQKQGNTLSASFSVSLPIAQETLKRRYHVVDGESIVWVDSELTSHLGFDRPVFWGEHATVSAPFLEPGKVAVDMPAYKSKTKAHPTPPGPTAAAVVRRLHVADGSDDRRPDVRRAHRADEGERHGSHDVASRSVAADCVCHGASSRQEAADWLGLPSGGISVGADLAVESGAESDGEGARVRHPAVRPDARGGAHETGRCSTRPCSAFCRPNRPSARSF